jgi:HD-GYP domain-containing protein (c-di-GMP phosphodiesterase class II)
VALGWTGRRLETLRLGGSLHDVGKISVHASVLRKPGPLTDEEFGQIRRHPVAGARLVECFDDFLVAVPSVLHHHERWDGTGYPDGLAATAIPIEARIVAAADAYAAMTADRPYSSALSRDDAVLELRRCSGTQLDPGVVTALLSVLERPSLVDGTHFLGQCGVDARGPLARRSAAA